MDALAEKAKTTNQTISRIELGQSSPEDARTRRTIILIARALNKSFGEKWLRDELQQDRRDVAIRQVKVRPSRSSLPPPRQAPIVGRVAAGRPIDHVIEGETETVDVPRLIKFTNETCALSVAGESMVSDHILDRDILICRRMSPNDMPPNAIAVVELHDLGATVKRWRRKGQSVTLGSETYSVKQIRQTFQVTGLIRKMN